MVEIQTTFIRNHPWARLLLLRIGSGKNSLNLACFIIKNKKIDEPKQPSFVSCQGFNAILYKSIYISKVCNVNFYYSMEICENFQVWKLSIFHKAWSFLKQTFFISYNLAFSNDLLNFKQLTPFRTTPMYRLKFRSMSPLSKLTTQLSRYAKLSKNI